MESEWRVSSDAMASLSRNDITALKMLKPPTPNVRAAMECLGAVVLAGSPALSGAAAGGASGAQTPRGASAASAAAAAKTKSLHPTDDWAALHSLLVKPNFLSLLKDFNERSPAVPEKLCARVQTLQQAAGMSVEAVHKASPAAAVLWRWLISYWRLKTGVQAAAAAPAAAAASAAAAGGAAAPAAAQSSGLKSSSSHSSLAGSGAPAAAAAASSSVHVLNRLAQLSLSITHEIKN
jgi:hypothetical protein